MKEENLFGKRKIDEGQEEPSNQSISKKLRTAEPALQNNSTTQSQVLTEEEQSPTKIPKQFRRLDSLARLIAGDTKCAAVLFDGEKFILSNNKLHSGTQLLKLDKNNQDKEINASRNLTIEVMEYFSKVATRAANLTDERKNLFPKIAKLYIQGILEKSHQDKYFELSEKWARKFIDKNIFADQEFEDLTKEELRAIGADTAEGAYLGAAEKSIKRLYKDLKKIEQ